MQKGQLELPVSQCCNLIGQRVVIPWLQDEPLSGATPAQPGVTWILIGPTEIQNGGFDISMFKV